MNVSEEASLERLLEAQKVEQVKACRWAEVESVSEVGSMGQLHSPLVLKKKKTNSKLCVKTYSNMTQD